MYKLVTLSCGNNQLEAVCDLMRLSLTLAVTYPGWGVPVQSIEMLFQLRREVCNVPVVCQQTQGASVQH